MAQGGWHGLPERQEGATQRPRERVGVLSKTANLQPADVGWQVIREPLFKQEPRL